MMSKYTGDESTVTSTKLLNYKRVVRVSDAVAPSTMFQKMKGDSSTDISDKVLFIIRSRCLNRNEFSYYYFYVKCIYVCR